MVTGAPPSGLPSDPEHPAGQFAVHPPQHDDWAVQVPGLAVPRRQGLGGGAVARGSDVESVLLTLRQGLDAKAALLVGPGHFAVHPEAVHSDHEYQSRPRAFDRRALGVLHPRRQGDALFQAQIQIGGLFADVVDGGEVALQAARQQGRRPVLLLDQVQVLNAQRVAAVGVGRDDGVAKIVGIERQPDTGDGRARRIADDSRDDLLRLRGSRGQAGQGRAQNSNPLRESRHHASLCHRLSFGPPFSA